MRIHDLLPPVLPVPPREQRPAPQPSRSGVALAKVEGLQDLWRRGQQRRRRPDRDSDATPEPEATDASPSPGGLNITA